MLKDRIISIFRGNDATIDDEIRQTKAKINEDIDKYVQEIAKLSITHSDRKSENIAQIHSLNTELGQIQEDLCKNLRQYNPSISEQGMSRVDEFVCKARFLRLYEEISKIPDCITELLKEGRFCKAKELLDDYFEFLQDSEFKKAPLFISMKENLVCRFDEYKAKCFTKMNTDIDDYHEYFSAKDMYISLFSYGTVLGIVNNMITNDSVNHFIKSRVSAKLVHIIHEFIIENIDNALELTKILNNHLKLIMGSYSLGDFIHSEFDHKVRGSIHVFEGSFKPYFEIMELWKELGVWKFHHIIKIGVSLMFKNDKPLEFLQTVLEEISPSELFNIFISRIKKLIRGNITYVELKKIGVFLNAIKGKLPKDYQKSIEELEIKHLDEQKKIFLVKKANKWLSKILDGKNVQEEIREFTRQHVETERFIDDYIKICFEELSYPMVSPFSEKSFK